MVSDAPRVVSQSTVFWKFVFPGLWIVGFGAGAIASALFGESQGSSRWVALGIWLVSSPLLVFFSARLRWVAISGESLRVSSYFREAAVPLSAVSRVTQSYLSRPQTLTVHVDRDTPLGRSFSFVAPGWPRIFSKHPLAIELEQLATKSQYVSDATI